VSRKSKVPSPKKEALATRNLQLATPKGSALITGAAKRIGKSIALHLASIGYDIGLHYNHSYEEAENTAEEIRKLGVKCELFKADLRNIDEVMNLAREAPEMLKDYNLLVNNAAIFERISFLETTPDDFARHMDINFRSAFFLTQNFAKTQRGNVINLTDTFISKTKTAYFSYMLSKKLLYDFTKMAASDLAPEIRVNALALGVILPSSRRDAEYKKRKEQTLPLKKIATLEDINRTIEHILRTSVTGECFFLDGGEKLL